jgi:hypothetical protein
MARIAMKSQSNWVILPAGFLGGRRLQQWGVIRVLERCRAGFRACRFTGLSSPVFGPATGKSPKPADNVPPFDPSHPDPIGSFAVPASPQATTVKPEGN